MTLFPRIKPNGIAFDMGRSNISEVATLAGPVRFRHSSRINGHTLELTYRGLSQTQVELIRDHYYDSQGLHNYFAVPSDVWGGLNVVSSDAIYRYAAPVQESHEGLYYNVSVSLRVIDGSTLIFILECNGAAQPAAAEFNSFAFSGTAPFILDCGDDDPVATLLLESGGASL